MIDFARKPLGICGQVGAKIYKTTPEFWAHYQGKYKMKISKDNLTNRLHEADAQYYIAKSLYYGTSPSMYYEIYKDESERLFYDGVICLLDEAINFVPELFSPMPHYFFPTVFPILEFRESILEFQGGWHRHLIKSKDTDQQQYEYNLYLKSKAWLTIKRKDRMIIDKYTCVRCGSPAKQVHHKNKNYDNIEKETMDDLESLCQPCHSKEHST